MSRRNGSPVLVFAGAAVVGLVGGWLLAMSHDEAHRHDLFAPSAWRRFAALGWLERHGSEADIGVLNDFLGREQQPALRSRARRAMATLKAGQP